MSVEEFVAKDLAFLSRSTKTILSLLSESPSERYLKFYGKEDSEISWWTWGLECMKESMTVSVEDLLLF